MHYVLFLLFLTDFIDSFKIANLVLGNLDCCLDCFVLVCR